MRGKLLLLCIALVPLLLLSCQTSISEGELTAFSTQVRSVEASILTAFSSADGLLSAYIDSAITGETARAQVLELRDEVRNMRNQLLILSVPDALHQLKLAFLDAADKAAMALQYGATFAETGDETMLASWLATRDQAMTKLNTAGTRLNRWLNR